MNQPHRVLLAVVPALLAACKGDFNPNGIYAGTLTETSQVMAGPAGAAAGNASNTSRPNPNAQVTVEAAGPGHVRVRFSPTCAVLFDLDPAPNEQNAHVAAQPPQSCTVDVSGYRGSVPVTGFALFARGNSNVTQLSVTGPISAIGAAGTWAMTFDGTTPTH